MERERLRKRFEERGDRGNKFGGDKAIGSATIDKSVDRVRRNIGYGN